MHFHIVPGDELPIYRQIMRQIIQGLASGQIQPAEQLPSHRDLAETLVISPLTVKKAYDELERDGLIYMARGQGTFVNAKPPARATHEKMDRLRDTAQRLLSEAHASGISYTELLRLLKKEQELLAKQRQMQNKERL
jgi:GntR family transcriptional regulator